MAVRLFLQPEQLTDRTFASPLPLSRCKQVCQRRLAHEAPAVPHNAHRPLVHAACRESSCPFEDSSLTSNAKLHDQRQLALAQAGVMNSPDLQHRGPSYACVPPQVACVSKHNQW